MLQILVHNAANACFIIDKQDRWNIRAGTGLLCELPRLAADIETGEQDLKCGAFAHFARSADVPLTLHNDAVNDCQTEAAPGPRPPSGEVGFENAGERRLVHAVARVRYPQPDIGPRFVSSPVRTPGIHLDGCGLDPQ